MATEVRTAVIPAAGLGTRFLPLTKAVPKELMPLVDRPVIHYVAQEAMASGIDHVAIVTAEGKEALERYFTPTPDIENMMLEKGMDEIAAEMRLFAERLRFSYPVQNQQLGLGHAVLCARAATDGQPFAVLLPDDLLVGTEPVLTQMLHAWQRNPGNYLAVEEVPPDRVSSYGVVDIASEGHLNETTFRLRGVVEKPPADQAPSNLGIVGRYILMPEVFDALERTPPGAIGEIQLTDAIALTMERQPTYAYRFAATRYDCGTPLGLLRASLAVALRNPDIAPQVRKWLEEFGL